MSVNQIFWYNNMSICRQFAIYGKCNCGSFHEKNRDYIAQMPDKQAVETCRCLIEYFKNENHVKCVPGRDGNIHNGLAMIHNFLGNICRRDCSFGDPQYHYKKAIHYGPNVRPVLCDYGLFLIECQNDCETGERFLKKSIVGENPPSLYRNFRIGKHFLMKSDFKTASEYLRIVIGATGNKKSKQHYVDAYISALVGIVAETANYCDFVDECAYMLIQDRKYFNENSKIFNALKSQYGMLNQKCRGCKCDQYRAQVNDLEAKMNAIKHDCTQIDHLQAKMDTVNSDHIKTVDSLQLKIHKLDQQCISMKNKLWNAEDDCRYYKEQRNKLKSQNKDKDNQIENLTNKNNHLQYVNNYLIQKIYSIYGVDDDNKDDDKNGETILNEESLRFDIFSGASLKKFIAEYEMDNRRQATLTQFQNEQSQSKNAKKRRKIVKTYVAQMIRNYHRVGACQSNRSDATYTILKKNEESLVKRWNKC